MKYLKKYHQINESLENLTIDEICQMYNIRNYTINTDGSVDVDGDVDLTGKGLTRIPLNFRKVSGYFSCDRNQLTSLIGCPQEVGGDFATPGNSNIGNFWCGNNQLTSLEGAPKKVRSFYCQKNKLTTLKGAPTNISMNFNCEDNQLKSLQYAPETNRIFCNGNPVSILWEFFRSDKFIYQINNIYVENLSLIKGDYLDIQVMEQISEDLSITLPTNWIDMVESYGYKTI